MGFVPVCSIECSCGAGDGGTDFRSAFPTCRKKEVKRCRLQAFLSVGMRTYFRRGATCSEQRCKPTPKVSAHPACH